MGQKTIPVELALNAVQRSLFIKRDALSVRVAAIQNAVNWSMGSI